MESSTAQLIENSRAIANREGIDFVSEYEFHKLFSESPGASFILQGYAKMLGCETYSYSHTKLTVEALSAFIAAFNQQPKGDHIDALWKQTREIFGLVAKEPEKAAK